MSEESEEQTPLNSPDQSLPVPGTEPRTEPPQPNPMEGTAGAALPAEFGALAGAELSTYPQDATTDAIPSAAPEAHPPGEAAHVAQEAEVAEAAPAADAVAPAEAVVPPETVAPAAGSPLAPSDFVVRSEPEAAAVAEEIPSPFGEAGAANRETMIPGRGEASSRVDADASDPSVTEAEGTGAEGSGGGLVQPDLAEAQNFETEDFDSEDVNSEDGDSEGGDAEQNDAQSTGTEEDDSIDSGSEDLESPEAELADSPSEGFESDDSESEDETAEEDETADDTPADDLRDRLVDRFAAWVDRVLVEEPSPDGVPMELLAHALEEAAGREGPPEPAADLYALFSAMTGLTGEVRLQGRAFKQLSDALAPLSELAGRLDQLEAARLAASDELSDLANLAREQAYRAARSADSALPKAEEVLTVLFDLYDRLERGERLLSAPPAPKPAPPPPGWFDRMLGRGSGPTAAGASADPTAALDAVREGYRLTLARLEAAFHQWGVERIGRVGEMFDPAHMAVMEVRPGDGAPDGTILDVYRSGYAVHGRMLVTAQVTVAKGSARPAATPPAQG